MNDKEWDQFDFFFAVSFFAVFFQSRSVDVPLLQSNFPGCAFFSFSLFSSLVFHLHGVCKVWQESIETETQKVAFASLDKFNLLVHMVVVTTYKMFEKISNEKTNHPGQTNALISLS